MKSLWRWASGGKCCNVRVFSSLKKTNIPFRLLYRWFFFCERGRPTCVLNRCRNFYRMWWKNMPFTRRNREHSLCLWSPTAIWWNLVLFYAALLHNNVTLGWRILCTIVKNVLFFLVLFFPVSLKWGENCQKVTQRPLPENWGGSCSHRRPSVMLRLSSVRLTGTRISSSGPLDQWTDIICRPDEQQTLPRQHWIFWRPFKPLSGPNT